MGGPASLPKGDGVPVKRVPACHEDAYALLREHGIRPQRIIRVEPDRVLYVSQMGNARTVLIHISGQVIRLEEKDGFPI